MSNSLFLINNFTLRMSRFSIKDSNLSWLVVNTKSQMEANLKIYTKTGLAYLIRLILRLCLVMEGMYKSHKVGIR